jgi:glutathione S-transferase
VWFTHYHPEKIPSARQRYVAEVQRVIMVLDKWLKDNGTLYLVGDKCTYADLAFITWCDKVKDIDTEGVFDVQEKHGAYHEWLLRLKERPAVKKALEDRAQNLAQGRQ